MRPSVRCVCACQRPGRYCPSALLGPLHKCPNRSLTGSRTGRSPSRLGRSNRPFVKADLLPYRAVRKTPRRPRGQLASQRVRAIIWHQSLNNRNPKLVDVGQFRLSAAISMKNVTDLSVNDQVNIDILAKSGSAALAKPMHASERSSICPRRILSRTAPWDCSYTSAWACRKLCCSASGNAAMPLT